MRIVKSICSAISSILFLTRFSIIVPALLIAGFLSSMSVAATPDSIAGALTDGQTVTLKGNVHRKALPQFDQGLVDPAMRLGTITLMTPTGLSQNEDIGEANLSFTFTPAANSYQVAQGSPIDATFTVAMNSGFTGPVNFTCTDPAPASVCTAPQAIGATANVSFHITTALPTTASLQPSDAGRPIFYAAFLPGLLGILFTAGSRRKSLRGMRFLGLVVVLGFSTLWLASCGGGTSGGNSSPGTTKGTYTITVTAASGATTSTQTFSLVVQ